MLTRIISGLAILKEYAVQTEADMNPIMRKAKEMLSNFCCYIFFGKPKTKKVGTGATASANDASFYIH